MSNRFVQGAFFVVFLLFSGTVHELCHALAADYFGDNTPRFNNRLTLNPIPHIDPIWTILMPVGLLFLSGGAFAFGGAKPVSMNPANFRHPERDFTIAAAVGPLSNFVLAGICIIVTIVIERFGGLNEGVYMAMYLFYFTNIILGGFNLIPIPPLDGSRILRYYLPRSVKKQFDRLSGPMGMVLIIILAFSGIFGLVIGPFINQARHLFNLMVLG
jgi:Zn-dependent protease